MITGMPRIAIATNDFDGLVTLFREVFGLPVIDISDTSVDSLGAKLAMCVPSGGSNIELMSPAIPEAPLSQSLQRFLDRRGEGLFALMLEAPVPNDEVGVLSENGLNVLPLMAGAGGRDVHPNSTHGVLIRVYPENSFAESQPETEKSLGLSGISRVMIAVNDIDQAGEVYRDGFGFPVSPIVFDDVQGVTYLHCHPPAGGVIELVAVADDSKPLADAVATHLRDHGEGMYALVLQSSDVDAVVAGFSSRGVSVPVSPDGVREIEVHGVRIRIESAK